VLTLAKIGAAGAADYAGYLASCEAHGDYYINADGDPWAAPGEWLGGLVAALGLTVRDITAELLVTLMEGRDPRTGEVMIRRGPKGDHVAAHDLTFSAPSSVTVLWAVGSPELRAAVQAAHAAAVSTAVAYVERELPLVYRRDPTRRDPNASPSEPSPRIHETAAAVLCARFDHHTSRQTAAQAAAGLPPDPQLHSHVLLLGAQRKDGRVVAVDSLTLHRRRSEVGAVYRAALAGELSTRLGIRIERGTGTRGRYFEVAGVSAALREAWSSRHREISTRSEQFREDFQAAFGRDPSVAEEREWAAKTRAKKARWHRGDIAEHWRVMADHYGVTAQTLDALRTTSGGGGVHGVTGDPIADTRRLLMREVLGPQGVTAEHATFDMTTLRRFVFERAPGLLDVEGAASVLEDLIAPRPDAPPTERVVTLDAEAGVYTTAEMVELEQQVLAWRQRRRRDDTKDEGEGLNTEAWEAYLAGLSPVRLSGEQVSAVQALLTGETFVPVTGEAGVGKSVVLGTFANAWRKLHADAVVYAVAVSGHRAQEFARDLSPGSQRVVSLTLDSLVHRLRTGALMLGAHDVVALDEAGQVETRRWAAFASAVGDSATVVAVGDAGQRSSIGAGGLWEHLAQDGPRLTEVRRTKHAWEREAWALLRDGDARGALLRYAQVGHLSVHATRAAALEAAVDAWDRDGRGGLLVTDASNAERYRANIAAQQRRLRAGELGGEAVYVSTAQGPVGLRAGDRVIFRGRFSPSPAGAQRVENGTAGDVVSAAGGVITVRTDRGADVTVPAASGVLDLHYAAHVALAQGTTVDRAYVVAGGWQTDRESLYVQVSRSRDGSRIFLDRESALSGGELGGSDVEALRAVADRVSGTRAKRAAVTAGLPRTAPRVTPLPESVMPESIPPARTAVRRVKVEPLLTMPTPELTPQERADFATRMRGDVSFAAPTATERARTVRTMLITPVVTPLTGAAARTVTTTERR
jgi:conjugative relaxase-like TrwC/TraI family protein